MEKNHHADMPDDKAGDRILLPLFPAEATLINSLIGVQERKGVVYYFNGSMSIFRHDTKDLDVFRLITSQLVVNKVCRQSEIVNCFGVSLVSVKRWAKRYREPHELGEFLSKKKSNNTKLTDEIKVTIQHRYSEGESLDEIIADLSIKKDTLQKTIRQGRRVLQETMEEVVVAAG